MVLKKEKVFRDPIHRYINVKDEFIWQVINTKAFQRLNNIHQLGGSYQVFHGAVHTRFGHSLGVYAIAQEIYEKVLQENDITEYERKLLFASALLHDLGHGPYSHASEAFLSLHHEEMTAKIILEDTSIRPILDTVGESFAEDIIKVLQKKYSNKLLSKIISSQIDVDRMDYLLRDSYYAGVPYGEYDKDRLIRVMHVKDEMLVFSFTGVHVLENFMISRYHMKEQVYNNFKGRAFESLLRLSVLRFKQLWKQGKLPKQKIYKLYHAFLQTNATSDVNAFLEFDDHMFMAVQHLLALEDDTIMSQIAKNIIERHLLTVFEVSQDVYEKIVAKLENYRDSGNALGYFIDADLEIEKPLIRNNENDAIQILLDDGTLQTVEHFSPILSSLKQETGQIKYFVYVDKELIFEKDKSLEDILLYHEF